MSLAGVTAARAQIPQKFVNLHVLPADISRDSLRSQMRGFASALGVQCVYCHTGGDSVTLVGVDWASDAKATKRKAREMYEMVAQINEQLDATALPRPDPIRVECATCHHGLPRPEALQAVLARTIEREGVPAAIAQYHELRKRFLTRGRYDFGEASLNVVGAQLTAQGRDRDAIAVLELNREVNPGVPTMSMQLAELYRKTGERERARELYDIVIAAQPRNLTARLRWSDVTCRRSVGGLMLTSADQPKLKLVVDSTLEYIGCQSFTIKGNARVERYHFIETDDRGRMLRLLVAHFEEALPNTSITYRESIPADRRGTGFLISPRPVSVGKGRYIHNVRFYDNSAAIAADPDVESSRTMRYLQELNVTVPQQLAWSRFSRPLPGARAELLFFYFEPASVSGFTLAEFQPGGRGDRDLERAAAGVLARSRQSFRVLEED
jgi:hypothetical protein